MKNFKAFKFETLGQLPIQDAVVGLATLDDGTERVFVSVLTEGLSDNKRKEKLGQVREQLNSNIIGLEGKRTLNEIFANANTKQTRAKVASAINAPSLVQYMMSKTDQPIVVLDCQEKAAFWQALRSLGVDNQTLVSLAELEHLKPQHRTEKQSKPVGKAHLLCESISKKKAQLSDRTDPNELIERIKRAHKIKIPFIDPTRSMNIGIANGLAELRDNPKPLTVFGVNADIVAGWGRRFRKVFGINASGQKPPKERGFRRKLTNLAMSHPAASSRLQRSFSIAKAVMRREMVLEEGLRQMDASDAEYEKEKARIKSGQSEVAKEMLDYSEFEGEESVVKMNEWGQPSLSIRDGYHFLRHDECLIEFEITIDDKPFTMFVLANQNGHNIKMEFFMRNDIDGSVLESKNEMGFVHLDENMQLRDWKVVNPNTRRILGTGKQGGAVPYRKMGASHDFIYIGHIMDIAARMNDPDYPIHYIEPTGGKVRRGRKHYFPYFAYEVVEQPLQRTSVRVVSNNRGEKTRSSPVFHPVARHTRTLNRGTPDEEVIIIGDHYRGDPSLGVKGRAADYS